MATTLAVLSTSMPRSRLARKRLGLLPPRRASGANRREPSGEQAHGVTKLKEKKSMPRPLQPRKIYEHGGTTQVVTDALVALDNLKTAVDAWERTSVITT